MKTAAIWVTAFVLIVMAGSAYHLDDDGSEATAEIRLDSLADARAEAKHKHLPIEMQQALAAEKEPQ